jgi:uncharacterized protein YndB with AHSA1/START domain
MTERSVTQAIFTIETRYAAAPARVFAAWASREAKLRWWFCHPEWAVGAYDFDFREGGRERMSTGPKGGPDHVMDAVYWDIVPDARIVFAYGMWVGETKLSASLTTVEFKPDGSGTLMVFTEQGAFFDGHQPPEEREHGTRIGLANLAGELGETDR